MRRWPQLTRNRIVLSALGVVAVGLLGLAASTAYENTRPLTPAEADELMNDRAFACAEDDNCLLKRPLVIYLDPNGPGGDLLLTPPENTSPGTQTGLPPAQPEDSTIPMLPPEKFAGENL